VAILASHYELLEKIGEGGFGTVFKARDLHVPRFVALKFIYPHLVESRDALLRFQQEARAICSLSHPNIVVLHDFDTDPETGLIFLVLEYLPGGTLHHLIHSNKRQGIPLPLLEICRCSLSMAAGLGHAHRHHVVHRDVKSANVMFSDERIVKVTDFGLARSGSEPRVSESNIVTGTLGYISPEQLRGQTADHRSDIFSLGIVIYEMATGTLPFHSASARELFHKILNEPTPRLKQVRPELPEELDHIVKRATEKLPAGRYQRMEELETDLLALEYRLKRLSEQPTQEIPAVPPVSRFRRRITFAAGVACLLLLVLGVWWLWFLRTRTAAPARQARLLAVVPFTCLGADDARKAFCDGLANTLSMKLTQMEAYQDSVLVVPYSEIRREGITSAADARRLFKVNLALTGSVEFIDQSVRVIINLVDAEQRIQTASNKLDSAAGGLIRLQDESSQLAAGMLHLKLSAAHQREVAAGQTLNEAAYNSFVRGVGYLNRGGGIQDIREAARLFEESVRLDPAYALAHARLAESYLHQYRFTEDGRWVDLAEKSCRRALELNGRMVEAYTTIAQVHLERTEPALAVEPLNTALRLESKNAEALRTLGNTYAALGLRNREPARFEEAVATFQQAIALRPDLWTTHRDLGLLYQRIGDLQKAERHHLRMLELTESADAYSTIGALYHFMDRPDDAIAFLKKSLAVRPTATAYSNLGAVCYYLRRYEDVIPYYENALRLSEENRTRNHVIWGNLAMACMETPGMEAKGKKAFDEAIRIAEARLQASPNHAGTHASLGYYLVRMGDGAGALRHAAQALELAPDVASILFRCTLIYERLKQRGQALDTLKRAVERGHPMKEVLNAGDLASLRQDPRFQEFVRSR
jgi:serine/threonine-protein kinase